MGRYEDGSGAQPHQRVLSSRVRSPVVHQLRLLRHDANVLVHTLHVQRFEVHTAQRDAPGARVVKAQQQVHHRRLAAAAPPHKRRHLPLVDCEGHAAQHLPNTDMCTEAVRTEGGRGLSSHHSIVMRRTGKGAAFDWRACLLLRAHLVVEMHVLKRKVPTAHGDVHIRTALWINVRGEVVPAHGGKHART
jgi:hypothetical protein